MPAGLVTAIRTLTGVPVPGRDAPNLAASLPWFPVVGLLIGLALWLLAGGLMRITEPAWAGGVAALVLTIEVLITRGLHLDGLADWADGFAVARSKEDALRIMKDPHVGAFAVMALVLTILLKWVSLSRLIEIGSTGWIAAALLISRTCPTALLRTGSYPRPEGGTGEPFVRGARPAHMAAAFGIAGFLLPVLYGPASLILLLLGWLVAELFGWRCRKTLGGVTGDILGACVEIVETVVLLVCAVGALPTGMPNPLNLFR